MTPPSRLLCRQLSDRVSVAIYTVAGRCGTKQPRGCASRSTGTMEDTKPHVECQLRCPFPGPFHGFHAQHWPARHQQRPPCRRCFLPRHLAGLLALAPLLQDRLGWARAAVPTVVGRRANPVADCLPFTAGARPERWLPGIMCSLGEEART